MNTDYDIYLFIRKSHNEKLNNVRLLKNEQLLPNVKLLEYIQHLKTTNEIIK